jgi:hypothetical protein
MNNLAPCCFQSHSCLPQSHELLAAFKSVRLQVLSGSTAGGSSSMIGAQPQAVGIPIYSIPMRTVVVGDPADTAAGAAGTQQQPGGSYWADAACMPPVQHPAIGAAVATPGATGAPAAAAAGAPVGGSVAMPFAQSFGGLPSAVLSQGVSYPPQPQVVGSPYASPYPAGPAAAAAAAATGAAATAGYYTPYPQQTGLAVAPVVGVAVPSAAAGGDTGSAAAAAAAAAAGGGAAGAAVAAGAGASGGAAGMHSQRQPQQ